MSERRDDGKIEQSPTEVLIEVMEQFGDHEPDIVMVAWAPTQMGRFHTVGTWG